MNKENNGKLKVILVIPLLAITGIAYFFFHFGLHDDKAISDFGIAYDHYDKAFSDFANSVFSVKPEGTVTIDSEETHAREALIDLKIKAAVRISSLTVHDAEIMNTTLQIADISERELNDLEEYVNSLADNNTDLDKLANEIEDLTSKRQAANDHFRELAGLIK